MSFLLDTDICSAHIKQRGGLTHRFVQHGGQLHISVISAGEVTLMDTTEQELAGAVGAEARRELAAAFDKIKHCLEQLNDERIWHRPVGTHNSIGNLVLHLAGNLRQWIVAGIGGAADIRDRPREFSERGPIAKPILLAQLASAVHDADSVLARLNAQELLTTRRIQGFDVTALGAIFHSVPHFRGHTQEIIHITRSLLGEAYQFAWTPGAAHGANRPGEPVP